MDLFQSRPAPAPPVRLSFDYLHYEQAPWRDRPPSRLTLADLLAEEEERRDKGLLSGRSARSKREQEGWRLAYEEGEKVAALIRSKTKPQWAAQASVVKALLRVNMSIPEPSLRFDYEALALSVLPAMWMGLDEALLLVERDALTFFSRLGALNAPPTPPPTPTPPADAPPADALPTDAPPTDAPPPPTPSTLAVVVPPPLVAEEADGWAASLLAEAVSVELEPVVAHEKEKDKDPPGPPRLTLPLPGSSTTAPVSPGRRAPKPLPKPKDKDKVGDRRTASPRASVGKEGAPPPNPAPTTAPAPILDVAPLIDAEGCVRVPLYVAAFTAQVEGNFKRLDGFDLLLVRSHVSSLRTLLEPLADPTTHHLLPALLSPEHPDRLRRLHGALVQVKEGLLDLLSLARDRWTYLMEQLEPWQQEVLGQPGLLEQVAFLELFERPLAALFESLPPLPVDCPNLLQLKVDAPLRLKAPKEWETVKARYIQIVRDTDRYKAALKDWEAAQGGRLVPNLSTADLKPPLRVRSLHDFLPLAQVYGRYLERLNRLTEWWMSVLRSIFDLLDLLDTLGTTAR